MAQFLESMIAEAKKDIQTIVLPEGSDPRILEAARKATDLGIAKIIVVGNPDTIAQTGIDMTGVTVIDNTTDPFRDTFAQALYEIRKSKGMTLDEAQSLMDNVLYFGTMMLKQGMADGLVGGACHATKDVLQPALRVIKMAPEAKRVSSFMVMEVPDCLYGEEGTFMFSDCAVVIQPSADDLSEIAVATAKSFEDLIGKPARVAMLSHASYGSVKDDDADKVVEAVRLAKQKAPQFNIDGELQADAALVPSVGQSKAPGSPVAGMANVLVFPDLDAANIGYKLVQRLAKAEAYGPVTQGLRMPMNDLSRGCSADDVVGTIAITAVQAQRQK